MKVTLEQTEKILKGSHTFKQFAFSMLITRLKAVYAKNPTQETLKNSANEINKFLGQFSGVMGNDYAVIANM